MLRKATHNSATGEKGTRWSWFVCVFSRTQDKKLTEQWKAGGRYFDLRLKWSKKRKHWVFGHGLWHTKDRCITLLLTGNTGKPTYLFRGFGTGYILDTTILTSKVFYL